MSDKNMKQLINIKFRVNIGRRASETLVLLTSACSEYTVKKGK
jgi:hypothetical protein